MDSVYNVEKDNCTEGRRYKNKRIFTIYLHNSTQCKVNRITVKFTADGVSNPRHEITASKKDEETCETLDVETCKIRNEDVFPHRHSIFSKQAR